ncbi:MAG: hypothetical protein M0Z27_06010 [Thermaerobacter sp.]|nr:hypothetical protein [Thermaerobacter sp.]
MSKGQLRELLAEMDFILRVAGELHQAIEEMSARVASADPQMELVLAVALNIARFYTAVEDVLEHIVSVFDEYKPQGPSWHTGLLRLAASKTPERPAVISEATYDKLDELRSFRHVVYRIYRRPLNWEHMERLVLTVKDTMTLVRTELADFGRFLDETLAQTER